MVVVNTIAVNVSDVNDETVTDSVRRLVQSTFGHMLGDWHVSISSWAQQGRWALHLRGPFGRHVAHFLAEPRQVPDAVERHLRAFLRRVVPPLSARTRPTIVGRGAQRPLAPHEPVSRVLEPVPSAA